MQSPRRENVVPLAMPSQRPGRSTFVEMPTPRSPGTGPGLVPFPRWQKACDRVSALLLAGEAGVVVTGPPGTGKTLLLDHTARVLRASGWTVMLRQADATPLPDQDGNVALLIDEADRLSREALERLLAAAPGPVVLAGLDVLQSRVVGATQITLSPLERDEMRDYIARWLTLTGRQPANLDPEAMQRVIEFSSGVPRLASSLLGAASWLAESFDETVITVQHVDEAAALRSCFIPVETTPELAGPIERSGSRLLGAVAVALLLLGVGAIVATRYLPAETGRAVATLTETAARLRTAADDKPPTPQPPAPQPIAPQPTTLASVPVVVPKPAPIREPEPPSVPAVPPEATHAAEPSPTAIVWQTAPEPSPPPAADPSSLMISSRAPDNAPIAPAPVADVVPTQPPQPAPPPPAPTIVATAAPVEPPRTLPPETISLLLRRGNDMMSIGDVSAARLLYGRAAEAGNTSAMVAMGRTFDPAVLAQASPQLTADPAVAALWYRRAADAGNSYAEDLLHRVEPPKAR